MKRKVIQIAESTQLISLPRKWAKKFGIKKGDELDVEEKENTIIVSTEREVFLNKKSLDLREMSTLKRRSICATYLKGYDEVEIWYSTPEYIQTIQRVLQEFTGYDIVKQGKNSCLVKQISKPTEEEFNNVYNRLFLIIHDTFENLIEGLKKHDKELLNSIQFREVNINKFANFCRRIINKRGWPETEKTSSIYFVLASLEFLGDEIKDLSNVLANDKVDRNMTKLLEDINDFYSDVYKLYKVYSVEKAVKNAVKRDHILQNAEKVFKKVKSKEPYFHVRRIIQLIIQMQEAIMLINI